VKDAVTPWGAGDNASVWQAWQAWQVPQWSLFAACSFFEWLATCSWQSGMA
jgi:hypothetical protein